MLNYVCFILKHVFDMPKTIWLNFILFPISVAWKLPILISHRVKLKEIKRGSIVLKGNIKTFGIKIGLDGVEGVSAVKKEYIILKDNSKIIFNGKANISKGISIRCIDGVIEFGNNFYSNCNLSLICLNAIIFENDVLLGWDINIRDCDGHIIYENGSEIPTIKKVHIEENVWICAHVNIMKGAYIARNSIVGYGSNVFGRFETENVLIGGYPAKVLKENVSWER